MGGRRSALRLGGRGAALRPAPVGCGRRGARWQDSVRFYGTPSLIMHPSCSLQSMGWKSSCRPACSAGLTALARSLSQCTSSCAVRSGRHGTCGDAASRCPDPPHAPRSDEFKGGFDYRGLEIRRPGGSECNDLLGVDRVALMFLSLGALPQDTLWNAWLDGASYLLPLQPLQV